MTALVRRSKLTVYRHEIIESDHVSRQNKRQVAEKKQKSCEEAGVEEHSNAGKAKMWARAQKRPAGRLPLSDLVQPFLVLRRWRLFYCARVATVVGVARSAGLGRPG